MNLIIDVNDYTGKLDKSAMHGWAWWWTDLSREPTYQEPRDQYVKFYLSL